MITLEDKVVLVTGASRGIGFGIADMLASLGASVVCSSTQQRRCDEVAEDLTKRHGSKCIGIACDVSSFDSAQSLVDEAVKAFGKIDVLVNNAGITRDNLILRMKKEDWDDVISTNLTSVFNVTKSVIKPMLKKKYGKIIHMSSIVGVIGNPGQANYAASKAGIIGFSKSIAKEFGVKGITSNVIAPGYISTDMIETLPKEYIDNIINLVPLRRLGNIDDISGLVAFLASDFASYITGEVIQVGGGI